MKVLALAKWASTRWRSWVAKATRICPPFNGPGGPELSEWASTSRNRRVTMGVLRMLDGQGGAVAVAGMLHQDVAQGEDQVAGAAIAQGGLVRRPQAVEHRKAGAVQRDAVAAGDQPGIGIGDDQVGAAGFQDLVLQVLEIADDGGLAGQLRQMR